MQSCHSPVNSVTGVPNVNTISPRKPVMPITMNGLFGDGYGFDESIAPTFSIQSPINRSVSGSKMGSISPSKSLSMELNYNQQPVLLSELADSVPYNLCTSGSLPRGSTLCSFVSSYDNSRCTNLAVAISSTSKSYCNKHCELAHSNPVENANQGSTSATLYAPTSVSPACSKRPLSKQQSTLNAPSRHQLSNCQTTFIENKYSKEKNNQSPLVNGMCYSGERSVMSITPPANSEVVFPLACVAPHVQPICASANKTLSSVSPNLVRAVPILSATVIDPNGKPKSVQIKQGNVHANRQNGAMSMDKDVLQAFVDFLNQNHDRLTPKQQLSLLNSLGVAVATVKNPDDYNVVNHQQGAVKPLRIVTQPPPPSGGEKLITQKESLPNKPNLVSTSSSPLKRKLSSSKSNSKKSRKNSLQHLTNKELNEKVQETIASMEFSSELRRELPKSKSATTSRQKAASLPLPDPSLSVPSVSVPMNKLDAEILLKKSSCNAPLNDYINKEIDRKLERHNLFPLGPFCDDDDSLTCVCTKNARLLPAPTKTKMKNLKQKKVKMKPCSDCHRRRTDNLFTNLFDTILKTTVDMSGVDRDHCERSSSSKDDPTPPQTTFSHHSRCRLLLRSARSWKDQRIAENASIRNLVAAAQTDPAHTAAVLKSWTLASRTRLRSRARCGMTPNICALTDRSGHRCPKPALPLSSYCRVHVMHSNHQQLYKLDADMNVIADIYPDPPIVRPRKKTKLPPLSKRKKRRTRKKNVTKVQTTSASLPDTASHTGGSLPAKSTFNMSQPAISDYVMDNSDETIIDVNSVRMPSVVDDSTLSPKHNLLDEESTSEMFGAFSFDGEELLHDVTPDMFSELGLDNAFLLTGAADSIDALALDELNSNESVFLNDANGQNETVETTLPSRGAVADPPKAPTSPHISSAPTSETVCLNRSSISTSSVAEPSNWPPVDKSTPMKTNYADHSTGFGDVSSSLDSSIAEDLNELEGVIESLRDETLKADVGEESHRTWDSATFASTLEKELSLNAEAGPSMSPDVHFNDGHLQVSSSTMTTTFNTPQPLSAPRTGYLPSLTTTTPTHQSACSDLRISNQAVNEDVPFIHDRNGLIKVDKKVQSVSSSLKRNGAVLSLPCQSHASLTNSFVNGVQLAPGSVFSINQSKSTAMKTNTTNVTQGNNKMKDATPLKYELVTVGTTLPSATVKQTIRMQPRMVSANVVNSVKTTNQNMILIPVNAVMKSNNQMIAHANNQSFGFAFTIPAQSIGSNVGAMIPIKSSGFLTGAGNNQPVLLLGGNPPNNVPLQANINLNQLYQASPPPPTTDLKSATTSSASQLITSQSKTTSSSQQVHPGRSISISPGCKPVKRRFNRHSIVIPPALSQANPPFSVGSNPVISPKPAQSRASVSSSTVHWNQTMSTAPVPEHRQCGGVGGQTSNMLFCRRINPSLNNKQHVIVGRLGSLGQMGLTRVTVKDPPIKSSQGATESKPSYSVKLGPSSTATSRGHDPSFPSHPKPSPAPADESSQLRDLSNQIHLPKSDVGRDVAATLPVSAATSSLRQIPSAKHSSRKSGHSQTLCDPDFCESPTKLSKTVAKQAGDLPQKSPLQADPLNPGPLAPTEVALKPGVSLNTGKVGRRASILRKR